MMDEVEEEALFARLRGRLEARPVTGADGELVAAVARVEASLRTLALRLDSLARGVDAQEASIEARLEAAVARSTAGLRAELDRLAERRADVRRQAAAPLRSVSLLLAVAILVGVGVAVWSGKLDGEAIRNGVAGLRLWSGVQ